MKKFVSLFGLLLSITASATLSTTVSFDMSKLKTEPCQVGEDSYSEVSYENLENISSIGEYSLPVKNLFFSVPFNAGNFVLNVTCGSETDVILTSPVKINNDVTIPLAADSINPVSLVKHADIASIGCAYGINQIVKVSVYPVTYVKNDTKVSFAQNVQVSLSWSVVQESEYPFAYCGSRKNYDGTEFSILEDLVENPADVRNNAYQLVIPYTTDQEDYEYIIICPQRFMSALERLAAWRRNKGFGAKVFSLEQILNSWLYRNGDTLSEINDDAGKVREFLRNAYSWYGTRYVLLAGKYPEMPIRCVIGRTNTTPSDLYFSDLSSSWKKAINPYSGSLGVLDHASELFVGRIPFTTINEINDYIDKLLIYERNPGLGDKSYLSRALMTRQYWELMYNKKYNDDGSFYLQNGYFRDSDISNFLSLYKGANLVDLTEPADWHVPTGAQVVQKLNTDFCGMHNFIGHGNPKGIGVSIFDQFTSHGLDAIDAVASPHVEEIGNGLDLLTNYAYPAWSYSMSCSLMPFDTFNDGTTVWNVDRNFGEQYILGKGGGVVFIGNTRPSYFDEGEVLMQIFFSNLNNAYYGDQYSHGVTVGEIMAQSKLDFYQQHGPCMETLIHNIFGDPLVNLWINSPYTLNYKSNYNNGKFCGYIVNGNKGEEMCMGVEPLRDATYAVRRDVDEAINFIPEDNTIYTFYYKYMLPVTLPLTIRGFGFDSYIPRYIMAGDVFCGIDNCERTDSNAVVIPCGADVTIDAYGDVMIGPATFIDEKGILKIIATGNVTLGHIVVPENATLIVEANTIETDSSDDEPLFMPGSNVQLISRNAQKVAPRSRSAEEPHMVVEGRTWWYGMFRHESFAPAVIDKEFGVRIGEEVEIDGKSWNKIDVIMAASNNGGTEWTYDFTSRTQAYIREENDKVYVLHTFENTDKIYDFAQYVEEDGFWRMYYYCYDSNEISERGSGMEVLLYVFGDEGDSYSMGSSELSFPGVIKKVGEIQSAGNTFKTYEYVINGEYEPYVLDGLSYIDGIGTCPLGWGTYGDFSDLFYAPGGTGFAESGKLFAPSLRYVTDSANNILYEGIGGIKIWEIYDSVTDVAVTPGDSPVRWYNLQGVEIAEPKSPGIYIRSVAGNARKVIIQ